MIEEIEELDDRSSNEKINIKDRKWRDWGWNYWREKR